MMEWPPCTAARQLLGDMCRRLQEADMPDWPPDEAGQQMVSMTKIRPLDAVVQQLRSMMADRLLDTASRQLL